MSKRLSVALIFVFAGCASAPTGNLMDRASKMVTAWMAKEAGRPIVGVPFESAVPGTLKWKPDAEHGGQRGLTLTKILAEHPPGWVLMLTVGGTDDDDALARAVLASLRTTSDRDCYWPVIRNMMRRAGGDSSDIERRGRAAAAAGRPQELAMSAFGETIIFNNNDREVCYTYKIPGTWKDGGEPSLYRSPDGRAILGLIFMSPRTLGRQGY